MEILQSFEPIVTPHSRILVLGTMPGVMSLEKQQYYGHPRNAFWPVMARLAGRDTVPATYRERTEMVRTAGIALWDVCHQCQREGSLDSNICHEIPNPIDRLLEDYPAIGPVVFNGQPAFRLFKRHFDIRKYEEQGRPLLVMPSTSPANASYSPERKWEAWSVLDQWLDG